MSTAIEEVKAELDRAKAKYPPYHSAHEGYAVILEELEELKLEVFKGGTTPRSVARMRAEAVQVAATALRFIEDLCEAP